MRDDAVGLLFLLSSVCTYIHFCFFTARAAASFRCWGGVRDVYYSPRVSASLSFPVYKRDKCGGQHRELNVSGRAGYCSRYWIPISSRPTRRMLLRAEFSSSAHDVEKEAREVPSEKKLGREQMQSAD